MSGAVGAAALACWLPAITRVAPPLRPAFGIAGGSSATVWLTFDDGPHPHATPAVLDMLEANGVRGVFFLVGEQVRRWPAVAARIAAAGHAVGVHCERHRSLLRLSPRGLVDDVRRAAAAIEDAAGVPPVCYRPPHGVLTTPALLHARRQGWPVWLWDCDGRDWRAGATAVAVAERILGSLRPGAIVLLHDSPVYCRRADWRTTPEALVRVLERLGGAGPEVAAAGDVLPR